MIEALVSIAILGVAMLGVSALQIAATTASREAAYRFAANRLTADLAERIRANPAAAHAWSGSAGEHGCINAARDCSPDELAAEELGAWRTELRQSLPENATSRIRVDEQENGNHFTIQLTWSGGRDSGRASHVHRFLLRRNDT